MPGLLGKNRNDIRFSAEGKMYHALLSKLVLV